jgi:hypothetical protein
MKGILAALLLAGCTADSTVDLRVQRAADEACNRCKAEGLLQRDRFHFQARCDDSCKPAPGVADSASDNEKEWRCGCVLAEKR